jgi:hypothetical protein
MGKLDLQLIYVPLFRDFRVKSIIGCPDRCSLGIMTQLFLFATFMLVIIMFMTMMEGSMIMMDVERRSDLILAKEMLSYPVFIFPGQLLTVPKTIAVVSGNFFDDFYIVVVFIHIVIVFIVVFVVFVVVFVLIVVVIKNDFDIHADVPWQTLDIFSVVELIIFVAHKLVVIPVHFFLVFDAFVVFIVIHLFVLVSGF